ncbi:hypothetical protein K0M31_016424 [Melipona bicolor]|uniref:Uncharacterized protein n=1 Tax=Melipona bicolor TaxID=60889 RepID=A0AA40KTG7_9HYME|nr:hypothetical protein K0M31_016424 [Melipona bicolor]
MSIKSTTAAQSDEKNMLLTENLGNAPLKAVPVMYDQSDPREKVLSLRNTVVAGDW